jgi:ADP-ribose pyrophosphatase
MKVAVQESEKLYQGFVQVHRYTLQVESFNGGMNPAMVRECIQVPQALYVLPVNRVRQEVILVTTFTLGGWHQASPWLVQCPSCYLVNAPDAHIQAQAMLHDVVGLRLSIKDLALLHHCYLSPGGSNEQGRLYLADYDLSKDAVLASEPSGHQGRHIQVFTYAQIEVMLAQGTIQDAMTLILLYGLLQP